MIFCGRLADFKSKSFDDLLSDTITAREMGSLGSAASLTEASYGMRQSIAHTTHPALLHLSSQCERVDIKKLNLDEIHQLCTACSDYGLISLMHESAEINPQYRQFLESSLQNTNKENKENKELKNPGKALSNVKKNDISKSSRSLSPLDVMFGTLSASDRERNKKNAHKFHNFFEALSNPSLTSLHGVGLDRARNDAYELSELYECQVFGQALAAQKCMAQFNANARARENKRSISVKSIQSVKKDNSEGVTTGKVKLEDAGLSQKIKNNRSESLLRKIMYVPPKAYQI